MEEKSGRYVIPDRYKMVGHMETLFNKGIFRLAENFEVRSKYATMWAAFIMHWCTRCAKRNICSKLYQHQDYALLVSLIRRWFVSVVDEISDNKESQESVVDTADDILVKALAVLSSQIKENQKFKLTCNDSVSPMAAGKPIWVFDDEWNPYCKGFMDNETSVEFDTESILARYLRYYFRANKNSTCDIYTMFERVI